VKFDHLQGHQTCGKSEDENAYIFHIQHYSLPYYQKKHGRGKWTIVI